MPHAGNYQRVYWAGAAIALMADVACRRQTAGRVSLDSVLARLAEQHVQRGLSAAELLAAMDQLAGVPAFRASAEPYLHDQKLPDLADLYRELGIDPRSGAALGSSTPLAAIREAIMAIHPLSLPLEASAAPARTRD